MTASRKNMLNLPNWLTLSRIAAVPALVLIVGLSSGGRAASIIAAFVFLFAALTDLLDGYLARHKGLVTTLGKFLDPLADKLLNSAAMIMLIPLGRVPAWVVFCIIGREIAITGLRTVAVSEGVVISASGLGKQKTLTQNIAIFLLLWHYPAIGLNFHLLGIVLLYIALVFTYWSGLAYFAEFFRVLIRPNPTKRVDNDGGPE